jgi:hypothetical protein
MLNRRNLLLVSAAAMAAGPSCAAKAGPSITIYKDPSCGCCTVWVDRLKAAGFKTIVDDSQDMAEIKAKYAVPADLGSCHTGVVAGYAIEGHVPPADIKRLLKEKPKALGIAVPGMPINSPGMEVPGEPDEHYTVWLFAKDGTRKAFAEHGA